MKFAKCLLCFFLFCIQTVSLHAEEPKITVVGAGLAGLTAAYRLEKLTGKPVEVFEARSRPGGRVYTICMDSSYEELGGKFLSDGGDAENIKALIHEMGLEIEEVEAELSNRKFVYNDEIFLFYSFLATGPVPDNQVYQKLEEWGKECDCLSEILDRFFEGKPILRHLAEVRMRNYEGNDSKDLSSYYLSSFLKFYSGKFVKEPTSATFVSDSVKGGNGRLVEKLAQSIKGPVHYNSVLKKITREKEKICLHFADGKKMLTDYLILAIPCSTLRDVEIEKDILPEDQLRAVKILQYGTNSKILIPFASQAKLPQFSLGNEMSFWPNNDSSIMTLYYGGSPGVFHSSPEEISQKIEKEIPIIKKLVPSISFPHGILPVKDEEKQFQKYSQPVGIGWIFEEFSKGSYSSWGVGQADLFLEMQDCLGEKTKKVFRPIGNKIFFAGEHTAIDWPATMEGAVESGERAARMIFRLFQMEEK